MDWEFLPSGHKPYEATSGSVASRALKAAKAPLNTPKEKTQADKFHS